MMRGGEERRGEEMIGEVRGGEERRRKMRSREKGHAALGITSGLRVQKIPASALR